MGALDMVAMIVAAACATKRVVEIAVVAQSRA